MTTRSFSIAEIMAVIAFAGLECLEIRVAQSSPALRCLIVGSLPMQNALIFGLLLLFGPYRHIVKLRPFFIGFQLSGWVSVLIYLTLWVKAAECVVSHLTGTLPPWLRSAGFQPYSRADLVTRYGLAMSYLTAPQLAAALAAGWINQLRSEITRTGAGNIPAQFWEHTLPNGDPL